MEITLKNLQKKIPLNLPQIKKIAKSVLMAENIKKASLSITFVSSQKICALNKKFLGRSYATDVLAFDLTDSCSSYKKNRPKKLEEIFGEIIISTDAVIKNSKEFNVSIPGELVLYVVHGILHLLGYDDHNPKEIKTMRKREQELLEKVGSKGVVRG